MKRHSSILELYNKTHTPKYIRKEAIKGNEVYCLRRSEASKYTFDNNTKIR